MTRVFFAALLGSCLSSVAFADVTIKSTTGKGMGMSSDSQAVTYIKGMKMRSDAVVGDTAHTTIFGVDAQKM